MTRGRVFFRSERLKPLCKLIFYARWVYKFKVLANTGVVSNSRLRFTALFGIHSVTGEAADPVA